jgi:hypothetical protein
MIHIDVDLHQLFCYMTALDARGHIVRLGRLANDIVGLQAYSAGLRELADVAVEACSFWQGFVDAVRPPVARVVLEHPEPGKATASEKLKNDRMDSGALAHLLGANLPPEA